MHLTGYHTPHFIAVDLQQLYKVFKITRVSFFGTQCSFNCPPVWRICILLTHLFYLSLFLALF